MKKYMLLLLTFPVFSNTFSVEDSPYCSIRYKRLCMGKGPHVGCQFPDDGPGIACINHTDVAFTTEIQRYITHYINIRRQRVAAGLERVKGGAKIPAPKVMMFVKWDQELAFLAQRLANQCIFMHDDCRATVRYPYAGQSVGEVRWRRSYEDEEVNVQRGVLRVLDAWWGERRRVTPAQLNAPFRISPGSRGTMWGHFSQLAVWTLQAIGCGAIRHFDDYSRLLLVCDFSHTNMLGQRTLPAGPRADCPVHTARKPRTAYPLLCAPVQYDISSDNQNGEDSYDDYSDDKLTTALSKKVLVTNKLTERLKTRTFVTRSSHYTPIMDRERTDAKEPVWNRRSNYNNAIREENMSSHELRNPNRHRENKENLDVNLETTEKDSPDSSRHKFYQSRIKPNRPGMIALLNLRPSTFRLQSRQYLTAAAVTLAFDKEDMIQLFKDTGFSLKPL